MDKITLKNVSKSFKNQLNIIKEMFDLFPNALYEQSCGSFNDRSLDSFRINCPFKDFAKVATDVSARHEDLFDWGRPKIIEKNFTVYQSGFFKPYMSWRKSYNFYRTRLATTSFDEETGKHTKTPEKEDCFEKELVLIWDGYKSWGLKDWSKDYKSIFNMLNSNPDKKLVKEYKDKVNQANEEVIRWKEEIRKVHLIEV